MELKEIAAISGKEGLFRILKPARSGVIVETLDSQKRKMAVGVSEKVSILKEISIYTTTQEGTIALEEVLYKMHEKYQGALPIDSKASSADLMAFIGEILPEYNSEKVYPSDVKKLVKWYEILFREVPDVLVRKAEEPQENTDKPTETPVEDTKVEQVPNNQTITEVQATEQEEKTKKKRSTKKKTESTEIESKVENEATQETQAEEKPKKTRSTKKKMETAEVEATSEEEKPKKRTTKKNKEA
ncbi:MAG: DUF5606 domain-containing protein [Raineya sp.]|nr:DUF5606 domain-containing protein [Raineya sp.]MDW8297503.1 DUF5606 domain-containing protein [Raineya sp.]